MKPDEIIETRNRWSKPLLIGVITGTALICIGAVAFSRTDLGEAAGKKKENEARARAVGLFYTNEDVTKAIYSVPDQDNGSDLVHQVMQLAQKNKWDDPKKLTESAIKAKWSEFESAFLKLEEASKRKHLVFKRDLRNPAAILFPEYSYVKSWQKCLNQMADFAAIKGDAANAKRYLDVSAYLASAMDEEGTIIGSLVRIAGAIMLETELKKILERRGKDPVWQNVVESAIRRLEKPYDVKRSLQLEHWFAVTSVDLVMKDPSFGSAMGMGNSMPTALKVAKWIPRFKDASLSRLDEAYAMTTEALPADPYDFKTTQRALQKIDEYGSRQGLSYVMTSIMLPVFSQWAIAMERESCYRNVISQAVTILKSGKEPAGLPLKDRRMNDLDGKPIRLKKINGQWVVYSVGQDQTDNGGAELNKMKGDFTVRLPR